MQLNELQQKQTRRVLIYGPPFSGKTTLAGTLAQYFKLQWFDLESGVNVLLNSVAPEHQQNVNIFQIPDSASWPIAIETMIKALRGPEVHICQLHGKVACARCIKSGEPTQPFHFAGLTSSDCVVIDSGTQLTASAMSSVTKNQDDLYKLQLDDFANLGKLLGMVLSYIQAATHTNVVVITHENVSEMNDKSEKIVPLWGTRNSSANVAKAFNDVVYMTKMNGMHKAFSSTTWRNNIISGSQTGKDLSKEAKLDLYSLWG